MTHLIQHEIKDIICATYYHLTAIAFYEEFVQHADFQSKEKMLMYLCTLLRPIFSCRVGEVLHLR